MGNLSGQVAVVLGASAEPGATVARTLADEGARLVLGGRSRDRLEALEAQLAEAMVVGTDVTRAHHPERLVQAALEGFGRLDILVYGARASATAALPDAEAWGRVADVNLKGFLHSAAAALPVMLDQGGGHIVHLSAERPDGALDRAAREAVHAFLRELAPELAEKGIRMSGVLADNTPDGCAQAVRHALLEHPGVDGGLAVYRA